MRLAKGFTIVEMLVVIMIIALMTTIVGVNLRAKDRTNLDSVARILMADLRYVRSMALVGSADTEIIVDVAGKHYFSSDAKINKHFPQGMTVAVTVDEKSVVETGGKIIFYPDGSSSGGKIKLSKGNRELEVITAWLNGNVVVR